jgi:hypothetical protein
MGDNFTSGTENSSKSMSGMPYWLMTALKENQNSSLQSQRERRERKETRKGERGHLISQVAFFHSLARRKGGRPIGKSTVCRLPMERISSTAIGVYR